MLAVISLGSNIEPKAEYLRLALERLSALPDTKLVRKSRQRVTDPVDVPVFFAGLKFLNQIAVFETGLEVRDFSDRMHAIEDALGRVRGERNGPRTIDLDLITFGGLRIVRPELTLPHPRAAEREFVMGPLREIWLEELKEIYDRYVGSYRDPFGHLPRMMKLKYVHTKTVVDNAAAIARGERFTDEQRFVSLAAALLHDTGRYEQLERYNTFKDSESVDHAVFSRDIVRGNGWLKNLPAYQLFKPLEAVILSSILYHNRRDLPDKLDPLTEIAANTVRDADKLDIFRVLEDQVAHTDWRSDSRAFWNLQSGIPPNPKVVKAIRDRVPVDYQNIKSLADFVLIQVGWMISELHFATSRQLCRDRKHLAFRRSFLAEIGGGAEADAICDLVV